MTAEIERKSLVANDGWRQHASEGSFLQQIYLVATRRQTVRIRTIEGRHAKLTVKIRTSRNRREEYEYDIPYCNAQEMFGLTRDFLRKTRYEVNGYIREVDVNGNSMPRASKIRFPAPLSAFPISQRLPRQGCVSEPSDVAEFEIGSARISWNASNSAARGLDALAVHNANAADTGREVAPLATMSIAGNEKQEHEIGKNGILPLRRDKMDLAVLRAKVWRCKETRFWQAVCAADEWTASRNFASVLAEPRARLPKYSLTPGFARRKSRFRAGEGKIMAEEINPIGTVAAVEATTPADVPVPKKRGPRAKKVALDATTAEASIAPAAKRGRKRKEAPVEAKAANPAAPTVKTRAKAATKRSGKGATSKPSAGWTGAVLDEIADLLQLEEENARLRKALADKLRAENADLKKRLGLN